MSSKLCPEDFPKPKYPLGTEVLVTAPDASGVPFVSVRRVVGVFLNPNLPNLEPFKCLGWLYLTEHENEHEGRYQTLAKEVDVSLPVPLEDLPSALEDIIGGLERLHASTDLWAKQSIDLPARIDELQDSVRALIEEIEELRDRPSKTN